MSERRAYIPRSTRDDWRTPPEVLAIIRQAFGGEIDLDPCAPQENPVGAREWISLPTDGLAWSWSDRPRRAFVNPPFSKLKKWAAKCSDEGARGTEVILLLGARTDTVAWHEYVATASLVCLWRGRIKFVGAQWQAPFPVAFAYWGPRPALFHAAFAPYGMVVAPARRAGAASLNASGGRNG